MGQVLCLWSDNRLLPYLPRGLFTRTSKWCTSGGRSVSCVSCVWQHSLLVWKKYLSFSADATFDIGLVFIFAAFSSFFKYHTSPGYWAYGFCSYQRKLEAGSREGVILGRSIICQRAVIITAILCAPLDSMSLLLNSTQGKRQIRPYMKNEKCCKIWKMRKCELYAISSKLLNMHRVNTSFKYVFAESCFR